jgi:hypothetical protein
MPGTLAMEPSATAWRTSISPSRKVRATFWKARDLKLLSPLISSRVARDSKSSASWALRDMGGSIPRWDTAAPGAEGNCGCSNAERRGPNAEMVVSGESGGQVGLSVGGRARVVQSRKLHHGAGGACCKLRIGS